MTTARKVTIDPISRLEGHGKVRIFLDASGEVTDGRFQVTQFRGYERFCEGRPFEEMPIIIQRICGICPVIHQLASAKACDAILGGRIPDVAWLLREPQHMGQFIQSMPFNSSIWQALICFWAGIVIQPSAMWLAGLESFQR
ncbi:MAG: nickel-dependent hydrogenase large subunit [Thermodesulfobacteriota bacterium]|nr:nickel-dependent hydrogenase large subunit [Thermodesulfobacteriota bacterium]